jgi:hypothetical protein
MVKNPSHRCRDGIRDSVETPARLSGTFRYRQGGASLGGSRTGHRAANRKGNRKTELSLDGCQGLFQIVLDVRQVFDSYRDADQTIGDSDRSPSLFAESGVSHGGRVRN